MNERRRGFAVQTTKFDPTLQLNLALLLTEPAAGLPRGIKPNSATAKSHDLDFFHSCPGSITGQNCLKTPARARITCNFVGWNCRHGVFLRVIDPNPRVKFACLNVRPPFYGRLFMGARVRTTAARREFHCAGRHPSLHWGSWQGNTLLRHMTSSASNIFVRRSGIRWAYWELQR